MIYFIFCYINFFGKTSYHDKLNIMQFLTIFSTSMLLKSVNIISVLSVSIVLNKEQRMQYQMYDGHITAGINVLNTLKLSSQIFMVC